MCICTYHYMLSAFFFPSFVTLTLSLNLLKALLGLFIDFDLKNDFYICFHCISTKKNSKYPFIFLKIRAKWTITLK